jgi:2-hydroxychromene-2-carboxylate isomerase
VKVGERLRRRTIPSTMVRISTVDRHHRIAAGVRRVLGGSGEVTLHLAFDDPYSAVALTGLARVVDRRRVRIRIEPVVERGIPGDPAQGAKRRYAIVDSRRLAQRLDLELSRSEPVAPDEVAFLAEWAAAAPDGQERLAFCLAAMNTLWFRSDGPVDRAPYELLWAERLGSTPPGGAAGRRALPRGLYDTPVALVHGNWYFAHERLEQVGERLDELGWRAVA